MPARTGGQGVIQRISWRDIQSGSQRDIRRSRKSWKSRKSRSLGNVQSGGSPDNVLYCLSPHSVCHRVIGTLLKDPNRYSRLYEEFPAKKYVNIVP
jgi:hypothetical protein